MATNPNPTDRTEASEPLTVAAVDLGSNSFHMVVGRFVGEDLHVIDRLREPVRLAAGLTPDGKLDEDATQRALACLERFGQRLRDLPSEHVRAVGTNTLRQARDEREFRQRGRALLGHPIEVISGQEEARLIYSGVAHSHHADVVHRLVVDIGGGSTEVIVGEEYEVLRAHSLFMGCVTWSRRYFPGDAIRREYFRTAEIAAGLELHTIREQMRVLGWESSVGASGTINAIEEVLRVNAWSDGAGFGLDGLKRLRRELIAAGHVEKAAIAGLRPDRAQVLPGGLAILIAVFKSLRVERMSTSSGALREGLLYDLVGRIRHGDVRDRTIRRLVDQYHVDVPQAARVERSALLMFDEIGAAWGLGAAMRKYLTWASRLHEIGLVVAYTGHHRHGAYLIANSDMPGFSFDDQQLLAALTRSQRRKVAADAFTELAHGRGGAARDLCVILRLAVLLNRSRLGTGPPPVHVAVRGRQIVLRFRPGWLAAHPLTVADLEREASLLRGLDVELVVEDSVEAGRAPADS